MERRKQIIHFSLFTFHFKCLPLHANKDMIRAGDSDERGRDSFFFLRLTKNVNN
jgi:hypothetical protein